VSRRQDADDLGRSFVRSKVRAPRNPLPRREADDAAADRPGMTHDDLVAALRSIEGLTDVGSDAHPNFQFRRQPFLHFHVLPEGMFADVRLGAGDFQRVWASTPDERAELLDRVRRHVSRVDRARKSRR
jgi:hypothetical protein